MKSVYSLMGLALVLYCFIDCKQSSLPKPKAYLALVYPQAEYNSLDESLHYSFDYNTIAQPQIIGMESIRIYYPSMKATVYLNYRTIEHNLDSLLFDAYLVPYRHAQKAEEIPEKTFINHNQKVYGQLYTIVGNAASQYQFYLTDSLQHFVLGSLYFYARPNYDSLYPAIKYIERDIVRMMESFQWN